MTERRPENLEILYEAFSKEAIEDIFDGETFAVDGVEFVSKYSAQSTADRFCIAKPPHLIEVYRSICDEFSGGNWLELGIAEGGSTALFALWAEPNRFVAVDVEAERLAALDEFIAARGLGDALRPFYGIDQADGGRLARLVAEELGGVVDIVIDDASHHYEPTLASFQALFPALRPGGLYVIEDWRSDHRFRDALAPMQDPDTPGHEQFVEGIREAFAAAQRGEPLPEAVPLSRLAIQLLLARAGELGEVVEEVSVGRNCLMVRRGPGECDQPFVVEDLYIDHYGYLPRRRGQNRT
jgi:predicted O-methyltransferase YrrM